MKLCKVLVATILALGIVLCLAACSSRKVNLQTENDAIMYLEDYVEENDRWGKIADNLKLYYTVVGSSDFLSTSYATLDNGRWLVVLHGTITGYTDYSKTDLNTFDFSYVAWVATDGTVSELFIQTGLVSDVSYS